MSRTRLLRLAALLGSLAVAPSCRRSSTIVSDDAGEAPKTIATFAPRTHTVGSHVRRTVTFDAPYTATVAKDGKVLDTWRSQRAHRQVQDMTLLAVRDGIATSMSTTYQEWTLAISQDLEAPPWRIDEVVGKTHVLVVKPDSYLDVTTDGVPLRPEQGYWVKTDHDRVLGVPDPWITCAPRVPLLLGDAAPSLEPALQTVLDRWLEWNVAKELRVQASLRAIRRAGSADAPTEEAVFSIVAHLPPRPSAPDDYYELKGELSLLVPASWPARLHLEGKQRWSAMAAPKFPPGAAETDEGPVDLTIEWTYW